MNGAATEFIFPYQIMNVGVLMPKYSHFCGNEGGRLLLFGLDSDLFFTNLYGIDVHILRW